jgi:hypothetical protein
VSILDETLTPTSIGGLPIRKAGSDNPKLNMLIYGNYGAGKTLLAGTADAVPEMRKVLFLDIEGGTFTLKHKFPNTDVLRITNWNQMADIYDELRAGLHSEYNTIVIDSLTEAQVFNLDEVMRELVKNKPDRSEDIPDVREWQINQKQVVKFIRLFRDLPVTVIMTALMKTTVDKMTGKTSKGPELPGKLAMRVPALFDEVFFLYVKKMPQNINGEEVKVDTRLLLTGATEETAAKDRSGMLPQVIVEPTMEILYDKMVRGNK